MGLFIYIRALHQFYVIVWCQLGMPKYQINQIVKGNLHSGRDGNRGANKDFKKFSSKTHLQVVFLYFWVEQLICLWEFRVKSNKNLQVDIFITSTMYNAFIVKKKTTEEQTIHKQSEKNEKYIHRYLTKTRPSLIDNYNKRINSFIRRMEEEPIKMHLDPTLKPVQQIEQQNQNKGKSTLGSSIRKRAFSNASDHRVGSSIGVDGIDSERNYTFKFKDNEDWKSLYTPLERIERKRNYQLFKQKYGDPTIAFRSIGSQSQYKPGHQYRERKKLCQIHPPMKYTNKPTKQILANIKNRKTFAKTHSKQKDHNQLRESQNPNSQTNKNLSSLDQEDIAIRRNTASSASFHDDALMLSDNVSVGNHSVSGGEDAAEKEKNKEIQLEFKKEKEIKLYFKEIMDLEQNIADLKTKKALRDLLYKCGVYRKKNRRAVTDSDIDQFSQFEAIAHK